MLSICTDHFGIAALEIQLITTSIDIEHFKRGDTVFSSQVGHGSSHGILRKADSPTADPKS